MKSLRPLHPIPLHAYLLYQIRFILAGNLCSAWERFGGLVDQMNALGLALNISATANAGISIAYDMLMRKHIAQLERHRQMDVDFAQLLSKENGNIKKQVIAQRTTKTHTDKEDPKKKGKFEGKGQNNATKKTCAKQKPWGSRYWDKRDRSDSRSYNRYGHPERSNDSSKDKRRSEGRSGKKYLPNKRQNRAQSSGRKKDSKWPQLIFL